jgi:hypothetical protein
MLTCDVLVGWFLTVFAYGGSDRFISVPSPLQIPAETAEKALGLSPHGIGSFGTVTSYQRYTVNRNPWLTVDLVSARWVQDNRESTRYYVYSFRIYLTRQGRRVAW